MKKHFLLFCFVTLFASNHAYADTSTFSCNGSTDDATVMAAWNYAKASGTNFRFPPNQTCNLANQESFDLNGVPTGMIMDGYGPQSSRLTSTCTASYCIKFYTSGGTVSVKANTDNFIRQNFSITCNNNGGVCVQDGDDNYDDSGSSWYTHNLIIGQNGTGTGTVNLKINYQVRALYDLETSAAGAGAAGNGDCIQTTWMRMSKLFSTGGGCTNSVHITGSHNNGNFIDTIDGEVVQTDVLIDGTNNGYNTFAAGYWNYYGNGIVNNATSTTNNLVLNPFIEVSGGAGSFSTGSNSANTIIDYGSSPSLPLSIANGGTGTASPSLVAGTNVTVTGSWPNQTISASGGGGGTTTWPAISATGSTQTIPGTGTWTDAQFSSKIYGSSAYNTSTYTYTVPATGIYEISAAARMPTTNGANHSIRILINGTAYNVDRNWSVSANFTQLTIHDEATLNSGDTVKIQLYQDTGSNKTVLLESFAIHQFSN